MKTSEFGKKMGEEGFTVYRSETDITFSKDGLIINIGLLYENPSVAFNFTNFGHNSLTAKQWSLTNSYLQTKPENRKKKRKWVITWGTNSITNDIAFWSNFTGRPYVARVDTDDDKEADGQTSLNVEEDGTKTPKQRAQDEKKVEA